MNASADDTSRTLRLGLLAGLLWLLWQAVRLPALALLKILEPVVCTFLVAAAFLGTMTALFWKFVAHRPHFPFVGVLAFSVGCFLLASLYQGLIGLLSGVNNRR